MSGLLSCLAITDIFTLITILIPSVTGRDVRCLRLDTNCGVMFYAHNVSVILAIWSLILVTYGRVIGVVFPIWARVNITKRRVIAVWFMTTVLWLALYCPYMFGVRTKQPGDEFDLRLSYTCVFKKYFESYLFHLQAYRLMFTTIVPLFLISVGSLIILICSRRIKILAKTDTAESSLSMCLLANNLIFFLTNAPVFAIHITYFINSQLFPFNIVVSLNIRDIMVFVKNINYSSNFVLYFITGSLFRDVCKIMFHIQKP